MLCSRCSTPVRPVVAIDIDGTLAEYHTHFVTFAELWLGAFGDFPTYDGAEPYREWFCQVYDVDVTTFRSIKLAYRQGGLKRTQPPRTGALRLLRDVRDESAEVWLTTTRPHDRFDRVDPDTRDWLRRYGVEFDGLLYSGDKMKELARRVERGRVVAVVDDQPDILAEARSLFGGAVPVMAAGDHNEESSWGGLRLDLIAARPLLLRRIFQWNYTNGDES